MIITLETDVEAVIKVQRIERWKRALDKKLTLPGKPLVEIWGEDFMEYRVEGILESEDAPMENYVSQTVAVAREAEEPDVIPDGTYYLREVRKRRDAMRGLQTYVTVILWEYDSSYYVSVT